MGIIAISRGSYTRGKDIAERVARRLGYRCISREILLEASKDCNIPEIKLLHAIQDAPSILDRITRDKEKYIIFFRSALYNRIKEDNVVYHGFAFHFFVKDIPHVLRVRINADLEDRLGIVMERDNVSRKEALRSIENVDLQRKKWGRRLYGIDVSESMLYDLVLNATRFPQEDIVDLICRAARLKHFQTTPASKRAMEDLALAAQVETLLFNIKPRAEICIENGFVSLRTEAQVNQNSPLVNSMEKIMKMIPAVKGIKVVTAGHPDDRAVCIGDPAGASVRGVDRTFFTELGG